MKKSAKKRILCKNIFTFLLCMVWGFILVTKEKITFALEGDVSFTILLMGSYTEEGYTAKACSLFHCKDISSFVWVEDNVVPSLVGEKNIVYTLNYKGSVSVLERKVTVVDVTPPEIELKGNEVVRMCPNAKYKESGYLAYDNYDGDITSNVISEWVDDTLVYSVVDSSDNKGVAVRRFEYVDKVKPKITLQGKSVIYLEKTDDFQDPGVKVSDNCDGNIEDKVEVHIDGDLKSVGKHIITYSVTDTKGNSNSVKRTIYIYDFNTKNVDEYKKSLDYYIVSKGYKVSIGYRNLDNGLEYNYNANKVYYGASLIKTLDALYVFEKMELTEDLKYCVNEAISISSNSCHKKLVDTIGINNLRNYGKSLGAKNVLTRGNDDYFANTTIADQLIFMNHLYEFIRTNPRGDELKSYFINTHYNFLSFDGAPILLHKYGYYGKYFHESGIVLADAPYIISILSEEANKDYPTIFNDLSMKIYGLNALR